MKNRQCGMVIGPIVFRDIAGQRGKQAQYKHGWKQNPHGVGFVKLNNQFKPVFRIISNHRCILLLKCQNNFANNLHAFH